MPFRGVTGIDSGVGFGSLRCPDEEIRPTVKRNARGIAKRATAPILGVLDRRFREVAERLERHTDNLASDQREQIRQVDDKLTLDVRLIDEHLLAVQRATRRIEAVAPVLPADLLAVLNGVLSGDAETVLLVAGPGQRLPPLPAGHDVISQRAFTRNAAGAWTAAAPEDPTTVRVLELRPTP
jgi:hypothetical protein